MREQKVGANLVDDLASHEAAVRVFRLVFQNFEVADAALFEFAVREAEKLGAALK